MKGQEGVTEEGWKDVKIGSDGRERQDRSCGGKSRRKKGQR